MELARLERLQILAKHKDQDDVRKLADESYEFDVNDIEDCAGVFSSGLMVGLKLAARVAAHPQPETASIFEVDVDDYADGDAKAYFVGTEEEVVVRLMAVRNRQDSDDASDDEIVDFITGFN